MRGSPDEKLRQAAEHSDGATADLPAGPSRVLIMLMLIKASGRSAKHARPFAVSEMPFSGSAFRLLPPGGRTQQQGYSFVGNDSE